MNKGKGNKTKKNRRNQKNTSSKKGLMDKAKEKRWNVEREDKRKTRKQNRTRRKKHFKDRPFGDTKMDKLNKKHLFALYVGKQPLFW